VAKSPDAFRTISEVATWLGTQAHVLRFWESKFDAVAPVQRTGGRRYYRLEDMLLLGGIKFLLHEQGMTIKAVQNLLKVEGVAHVQSFSPAIESAAQHADPPPRPLKKQQPRRQKMWLICNLIR
jgi:DNA-binding transcriptional MerR regulator